MHKFIIDKELDIIKGEDNEDYVNITLTFHFSEVSIKILGSDFLPIDWLQLFIQDIYTVKGGIYSHEERGAIIYRENNKFCIKVGEKIYEMPFNEAICELKELIKWYKKVYNEMKKN